MTTQIVAVVFGLLLLAVFAGIGLYLLYDHGGDDRELEHEREKRKDAEKRNEKIRSAPASRQEASALVRLRLARLARRQQRLRDEANRLE